ncbi:hypothetical protein P7C73_g2987, partial [Tremellales sp. Uapishka_1]
MYPYPYPHREDGSVYGRIRGSPGAETMAPPTPRALLDTLPDDVLSGIFCLLDVASLVGLRAVSHAMLERVDTLGIPLHLVSHPMGYLTRPAASSPYAHLRQNHLINTSLSRHRYHAQQIGPTWSQTVIPALSIASSRLVLGVGGKLVVHPMEDGIVLRGREYAVASKYQGSEADIVGVEQEAGNGAVIVGQYDGTVQRFSLDGGTLRSTARYHHPKGSNLHTMIASRDLILSTTSSLVSVFSIRSPWTPATTFDLPTKTRAWSTFLSPDQTSLALGLASSIAFYALPLSSSSPSPTPTRTLFASSHRRSSPYALTVRPTQPDTLLSGWYDSHLRLHDLRTPSALPYATFYDPWSDSAVYSCGFVGEHHLVAGSARHGLLSFFDRRNAKNPLGWSCFTPSGKGSPVYALKADDGGRVWGVSEKRAFVVSFDGSANADGLLARDVKVESDGRGRGVEQPSRWKNRGGKWGWTVRYPKEKQEEITMGYEHRERVVNLFESLPVDP